MPSRRAARSLAMGGVATDRVEQRFPFAASPYFAKYCLRFDGECRSEAMKAIGHPIFFAVIKYDDGRKLIAAPHVSGIICDHFAVHPGAWLQFIINHDIGKLELLSVRHFSPILTVIIRRS